MQYVRPVDFATLDASTKRFSQSLLDRESGATTASVNCIKTPAGEGSPAGRHTHLVDQVFYILSGTMSLEIEGKEYQAGPGRLTTITNAGSRIGTMREDSEPERASASSWISYFGVVSARDAQQTAGRNRGRTMTGAADSPIGRTALLADRQGATFAVLERAAAKAA